MASCRRPTADDEDASDRFFSAEPKAVFDAMALPVSFVGGAQPGGTEADGDVGGATGLETRMTSGSAAGLGTSSAACCPAPGTS